MSDHDDELTRLRYTAAGALAAHVAAGAIATTALADAAPAKKPANSTPPTGLANLAPTSRAFAAGSTGETAFPAPDKTGAPQPGAIPHAFFNAVQRLVDNGAISATEGESVDGEIRTGRVDSDTLAAAGFTRAQLQALQQAIANAKRALAPGAK